VSSKIFKKSILFTMLIIVIGGLLVLLYLLPARKQSSPAVIVEQKIMETEKPFRIEIVYPSIPGRDDFNAKAKAIVDSQLNEFKKTSLENDSLRQKTMTVEEYDKFNPTYYISITYDKGVVNNTAVSVVFRVENYTGGAHGNRAFFALNYNMIEKKEISLADIFPGQTNYLQKISDFCIQDLIKQIKGLAGGIRVDEVWIRDGASPKVENFSKFLFDEKTVTFYFPPYQIAPYALGDYKVVMQRD
jgi:hypothetical protein